jgi:hypothetical protein
LTDIRTDFVSGGNLIRLLQALKSEQSPSGLCDPDPETAFEKRVRLATDLGAQGTSPGRHISGHAVLGGLTQGQQESAYVLISFVLPLLDYEMPQCLRPTRVSLLLLFGASKSFSA